MAVYDDTTSPPPVSRRAVLAGAATSPLFPIAAAPAPPVPDPVLPLWQAWQCQHARADALCARWQDLEAHLMHNIGTPRVRLPAANRPNGIWTCSHAEIDQAFAADTISINARDALHAELTARQARWDAEAAVLGLDALKQQEIAAWQEEDRLSRAIFSAHALSLRGVEAKLALIVELCTTGSDDPEFPWPQLRSTLADIKRLRRKPIGTPC